VCAGKNKKEGRQLYRQKIESPNGYRERFSHQVGRIYSEEANEGRNTFQKGVN